MWLQANIEGLCFKATLDNKICVIESSESTAKTFVLKSLCKADSRGYKYYYYDFRSYTLFDWYHGALYDRHAIVVLDDCDICFATLLKMLQSIKCTLVLVLSKANASIIIRASTYAERYIIASNGSEFALKPKPSICTYCGHVFSGTQLTIDHIIPQSFCNRFGISPNFREARYNKVKVCFECNRKKSNDIWIPNYSMNKWMRYMTEEQVGGYSKLFVTLLGEQYENVVQWIFVKNMQSHVKHKLNYVDAKPIIEEEIKFFLTRYLDRKPGDWWVLV